MKKEHTTFSFGQIDMDVIHKEHHAMLYTWRVLRYGSRKAKVLMNRVFKLNLFPSETVIEFRKLIKVR